MATLDRRRIAVLPAFALLPPAELDELAAVMSPVEIEAGTELMTHGKDGYVIYFVEEGDADVLTDDGEVAHTIGSGDTLGEIAILVTGQRTATVVARTHMCLLALFELDFEQIRAHVPGFESSIRRLAAGRLGTS
jgi:CPA1 family monovalent cation:H+ antiporter